MTDDDIENAYIPYDEIPAGRLTELENLARSEGVRPSRSDYEHAAAAWKMGDIDRAIRILRDE